MRTAALFAIAVLFSAAVRAAAPKPEDWYTPETYADKGNTGSLYFNGNTPVTVSLDANGNILGGKEIEKEIGKDFRLKTALGAIQMALKNTKQIQTMGKNLNDLLILGGISIADNAGGGSYTVRFGDGTKSIKDVIAAKDNKGNVPATSDRKLADGLTLDWRVDNVNGKEVRSLQLKGARDAVSVDNYKSQWFRLGGDAYYLPFLRWGSAKPGVGELIWTNFGGFDNTAFGEVPTAKQGTHGVPLTLRGWYTNDFEHTTVTRLMTEDDDDAKDLRKKLQILARKTISDQSSAPDHLTYIPIGDVISGLGLPPDGVSIEDHVEGNATNLAIKGWHAGTATPNVVLANIMLSKAAEGEQPDKEYTVLVREHDNAIGSNTVAYASLGNLYGVTWATNWTKAVEHITKEETVKIVNWVTNSETIVTHVTNTVNWVTNEVISVTNTMNWVTNEVTWVTNSMTIVTNELVVITNTMNWVTNEMVIVTNTMNIVTNEMVVITNNINLITNEMVVVTNTLNLVTNEMVYVTNTLNLVTNEMVYITNTLSYVTNEIIYVTNTLNVISNQLNWVTNEVSILTNEYVVITNVTEKFNTIENWVVITNYLVNYLGGGDSGGGGGGGGGGGDAPPDIPPEHNPYSPQYKKDPLDEVTLPVKNAHAVIAITNEPLTMLESQNIFDFDVIDTNGLQLAQLRGFRAADASEFPMLPVKKKKVDITPPAGEAAYDPETTGDYALDWTEYPEELVKIAGGNSTIQRISSWLRSHTSQTNILELVATNYEALAAMKTNLWSHVRVDTLLDNQSTWTNGAMQIEVKGYEQARQGDIPVKDYNESLGGYRVRWKPQPKPDGDAMYDTDPQMGFATYHRTLERLDDYGLMHATNVWQLYGFEAAQVGQVPAKYEDSTGNVELKWTDPASAIKFVGTDPNNFAVVGAAAKTNTVTFASAADSNVHVGVAGDGNGNVTITIGVYYLTESALTPPVVE